MNKKLFEKILCAMKIVDHKNVSQIAILQRKNNVGAIKIKGFYGGDKDKNG